MEPGEELAEGEMIGRYRLVTRLGAGAMGVVWSAEDPQLERMIAIKLVHPMFARSPDASDRLLREARAMAKLSHRSVVTVHDAGEVDGRLFLAMELVPGTTLGQMLRARSPAQVNDWQRWLIMMIEAGQGLAAAHGKGVLHRDFKPDNVLVDAGGRVAVADFGLATLGHINDAGASQPMTLRRDVELTSTGALIGTPLYMSVEQLRGQPIDARADQFAFCVALYEAMYDAKPFPVVAEGVDAIVELIESIERGKIAPAPGSSVPDSVRRAIIRGLAAKPDARWPTLGELLAELSRAAGLSTVRDALPAAPTRRRHIWPILAIGGVLVAGALAAFALTHTSAAPVAKREPEKLFGVATHTVIALTPDGKRMVVGNDTLEVRALDGKKTWTTQVIEHSEVAYAEITDAEVTFSTRGHAQGPGHWAYATTGEVRFDPVLDGVWCGHTVAGDVVVNDHEIAILDRGKVVRKRATPMRIDVTAISPDRKRIAYIDAARFSGEIVVWDVDADTAFRSPRLDSPTAIDWIDDATLTYATGVYVSPTIWRATLTPNSFGASELVHSQPFGWFGYLRAFHGPNPAIYAIDMRPSARTRLIERTESGRTVHDFDATTTTVGLTWLDNHEFLAWARDTGAIERRTTEQHINRTGIVLPSEPANATRAGDTLIATVRTANGREAVAYSIDHTQLDGDGKPTQPLWRHPELLAVRCAGDRQAPCFAVIAREDFEQVVSIDPATGVLGNAILYTGAIEDIAVTLAGDIVHVADRANGIAHIDPTGKVLSIKQRAGKPWTRSLACQADGTILIGGTAHTNIYQVGAMKGDDYEMLTETENDILSLVRPSDDGSQVLFLARTFSPEVVRLQ